MIKLKSIMSGLVYVGEELTLEYDSELDETCLYLDNSSMEIKNGKFDLEHMLIRYEVI